MFCGMSKDKSEKKEKKCECKHENKKLKAKEEKVDELTTDLKRLQAEFENFQKRTDKEKEDFQKYASANVISDLLPVIDSLEQGIKHNKEFIAVYEQLNSILAKKGLSKIEVNAGDEFDHDTMECLMQEESKIPEGKVAQVLSTGYMLNDKILRLTKISISKQKEEN